eukprot:820361-Pleurochrysis_carterae.AAC.3
MFRKRHGIVERGEQVTPQPRVRVEPPRERLLRHRVGQVVARLQAQRGLEKIFVWRFCMAVLARHFLAEFRPILQRSKVWPQAALRESFKKLLRQSLGEEKRDGPQGRGRAVPCGPCFYCPNGTES